MGTRPVYKKHKVQDRTLGLGNNVYIFGNENQGIIYLKTTKAITDYGGHKYSKKIQMLVKKQENHKLVE